jgi:putative ABC transport system permease protein
MEWLRKLWGFLNRRALASELEEEIRVHLEMKAEDAADPAAARRQFGNTTLHLQDAREAWRWPRLDDWLRDLRYALRGLRRSPAFTATVVLTLALAIGSASTIYTLIDAVVIRPLPYPDSGRLVALFETRRADERSRTPIAPGRLEDWQQLSSTLEGLAGSYRDTVTDTSGAHPERISGAFVSPRFFSVLGAPPKLGRVFNADEERAGGPMAVVLSDALWRRRFGGDPQVLGRILPLSGARYTVVGVMPASFRYPSPAVELWIAKQARPELLKIREARFYFGVGRLKPGVTVAQAKADLDAVIGRLGERYPKSDAGWSAAVEPLIDQVVGSTRSALWLLAGAVSVLLLIGCANVACLLLSRLNARAAEIATRRSLGAGRGAIARQMLVEGLVYAFAGGSLGLAAAFAGAAYLRNSLPDVPRIAELAVDARMLLLVTATTLSAALLFSLAPVLQIVRRDLSSSWMRGGRGVAGSRQLLPRILVASQFALTTALLIAASLFLRSLARLEEAPLGFRHAGVHAFRLGSSFSERPDAAVQRHQRILAALAEAPGVESAAMSTGIPAANPAFPREFQIVGEPPADCAVRFASWRMVTAGYFQTLHIPILAGRPCRMDTSPDRPFEALINRSFADRYFAGRDPIGHAIVQGPQGDTATPIVGVVADVREDGHNREAPPAIYGCGYLRFWPDSEILVRAQSPAAAVAAARAVDPGSPVYAIRPLEDALSAALSQTRFRTLLVTLFSSLALTLAAIGLYGVMAYAVSQRAREIGIRLALGARRGQIVASVVRSGAILATCGAAAGIAIGAASAKLIGTLLYGVRPYDVVSYAGAVLALFAVALLACLVPARRAVSIDPTEALRES